MFSESYILCLFDIIFSSCADDPHNDPNVSGDPYKTLFVARLVSVDVFLLSVFMFYYSFALMTD